MIGGGWDEILKDYLQSASCRRLRAFLKTAYQTATVYPPAREIFSAFKLTPFSAVRVVIIGQDPYHRAGQANGLAFAVKEDIPVPRSLNNIFQEIYAETGKRPTDRTLIGWAKQGVLLLNTVLTVEAGRPGSHYNQGWEEFTAAVIAALNRKTAPIVYLLWGAKAAAIAPAIARHHLILRAPHPSPLSAARGFFGCAHFTTTNEYLRKSGESPIDWSR